MNITYFSRNKEVGFSIGKVFNTITEEIKKNDVIVNVQYMPYKRSTPYESIKNCFFVWKNRNKNGINHITGHIHEVVLGLLGCRTILTIHDLVFIDNVKNPIKRLYKWFFWLYLPIKISHKVVCISSNTKREILKLIKTEKLVIINNPIDHSFKFLPKDFNQNYPRILHIGTGWNKNLHRVIKSLKGINCHLRIIGKLTEKDEFLLKEFNITYSNAYNLTDFQIKQEYENCDIVSFPSEYEGFGMPIIEGQKTGRVVVCSKIEPLIEVGSNSVCYVNPLSISSIRNGFLVVIRDKEFRDLLIKRGIVNVERFSPHKIVKDYLNLYNSCIK